jgi:hypothetical protein
LKLRNLNARLRLSESDPARQHICRAESQDKCGRGKGLPSIHDPPSHVRLVVFGSLSGSVVAAARFYADTAKYANVVAHGNARLCNLEVGREHRIDTGASPAYFDAS